MDDRGKLDLASWQRGNEHVAEGHVHELGREFCEGMTHYPTHPDFHVSLFRSHGDRVRADGASSASCHLSFGGHTGTHMDALGHVSQDGFLFDGTPVENAQGGKGLRVGDAASLPFFVGRGVLFDIPDILGVARLAPDHVVTPQELEASIAGKGVDLKPGDIALVRTGWGQLWGTADYIAAETPGPSLAGAKWLIEQGTCLVGSDTAVFEKGPVTDAAPVHRYLLFESRIHIIENMDLEGLANAGVTAFQFIALPLRIEGGTASPLRPIGIC